MCLKQDCFEKMPNTARVFCWAINTVLCQKAGSDPGSMTRDPGGDPGSDPGSMTRDPGSDPGSDPGRQ